jgi:sugar/nucleoside kinase (ribokinase family)
MGATVVVGHATIDEIWLPGASAPQVVLGGAAVYAVTGALMAGARVVLVTAVGDDYDVEPLLASVRGVDAQLEVIADRSRGPLTIRNICHYLSAEERVWSIVDWDTLVRMSPRWEAVSAALSAEARRPAALVICPTPVDIAAPMVTSGLEVCDLVLLDTELHYIDDDQRRRQLLEAAAAGAVLLPSWAHLEALFGLAPDSPLDLLARHCAEWGLGTVVVKRGSRGCVVVDAARRAVLEVSAVNGVGLVDPTGAGDAFDGAFAVALARTGDPIEAACWGAVAGSFAVEHRGATVPPLFSGATATHRLNAVKAGVLHVQADAFDPSSAAPRCAPMGARGATDGRPEGVR